MWLAHSSEEWVLERLINTYSEVRVELEHAIKKVHTISVHARVLSCKVKSIIRGKALKIAYSFGISDK